MSMLDPDGDKVAHASSSAPRQGGTMSVKTEPSRVVAALEPSRPPHRLERLESWMDAERLDCTVVAGPDAVTHLGGYWRYYGGPAALVLDREGKRTLVVMRDEARIARELSEADDVVGYGERGFGIDLNPLPRLVETLAAVPAVAAASRVGFASELGGLEEEFARQVDAERVSAAATMHGLRMIKDEDELVKILAAYELCWLAQRTVGERAVPGVQEIELFTAALAAAQVAGGGPIEFLTDLLSGPNTAEVCCPIHVAGRRTVDEGDPVVADIALRWNGYFGDTAETHSVGSSPDAEAARATLLEILADFGRRLVPGAKGSDLFRDMSQRITDAFGGGEFPHHGGHALGVTSFEDPHVIPADDTPLESWMVIALEPGVYFPGRYGARVENVFVVTPEGGVELRDALGARAA
jgi:Xaa-Pro aminopeptidase